MSIHRRIVSWLSGAAVLFGFVCAHADQLVVTGANARGNLLFNLALTPNGAQPPITPVVSSTTTRINSAADGATHGLYDALVWVQNPYCKSVDLIVADAAKGQIVRYPGAASVVDSIHCYSPANGTPTVSPTAKPIFTWSGKGSGPAQPNGISADSYGNVFIVSSNSPRDPVASVWALSANSDGYGSYGKPILVDNQFGRVNTLALAETQVAGFTAKTSANVTLWSKGDLLVLVGDSFNARLIVYSQARLYTTSAPGAIAPGQMPVTPTVAIPFASFRAKFAMPFGMDLWPGTAGSNPGVLFSTIDGRILQFDTVQGKFLVNNFANGLGLGLQKLKVGSYSNVPYAFVAQLFSGGTGQIIAVGAPTANGSNNIVGRVSNNAMQPVGVAVLSFGSTPVSTVASGEPCAPPNPACTFAPLGANVFSTTIVANPNSPALGGAVQETLCVVQSDPRVSFNGSPVGFGNWSCSGVDLPIGSGSQSGLCPTFPPAIVPGSVCGHSGPTGAGFAVVEGTATGVDPNENNAFLLTTADIDQVMPGPINLECSMFATNGVPQFAWGTRSDLAFIEGVIAEDSDSFGQIAPYLGGQPGYLTENTNGCDKSTTGSKGPSIFVFGTALSNRSPSYLYTLSAQKFQALQDTISAAAITANVQTVLQTDVSTINYYVTEAKSFAASEGQGGADVATNINCALATIYSTDNYVRSNAASNPSAFMSNLITAPPGGGNQNPAGEIDSRLSNWYLLLNTDLQLQNTVLNGSPPTPGLFIVAAASVPPCTLTAAPYSIGGSVSGLTGSGLVLQDSILPPTEVRQTDTVTVNSNGPFAFLPADIYPGSQYSVSVQTAPAGQTCTVSNGLGIVGEGSVTNVAVACSGTTQPPTIQTFTVVPNPSMTNGLLFSWTTSNATSCNLSDANGNLAAQSAATNNPITGLAANGSVAFLADDMATGTDTDSYTLTCAGAAAPSASNTVSYPPEPAIATFYVGTFNGYVNSIYTASNSAATYCIFAGLMEGGYAGQFGGPCQEVDDFPSPPANAAPGYGTDTFVFTVFGPAGTTPATQSLLDTTGYGVTTPQPSGPLLSITGLSTDGQGDLTWSTQNSTANTTCSIMSEFSATPGQSTVNPPITGLPASNSGYAYPYFQNASTMCAYGGSDTITLSCADPTSGSAIQTLKMSLSPSQVSVLCP